jgi:hypothetical protein
MKPRHKDERPKKGIPSNLKTPEQLAKYVETMVCSFWDWPGNRGMSNAELVYKVALEALHRMQAITRDDNPGGPRE